MAIRNGNTQLLSSTTCVSLNSVCAGLKITIALDSQHIRKGNRQFNRSCSIGNSTAGSSTNRRLYRGSACRLQQMLWLTRNSSV
ncbi:hypothetical protein CRE_30548 [Caenorhabditis remanei]|uniref:Uncharacterized protein n=1 Tax=Caenorhabditis remanei TaxID=31234 RepID=E3NM38_CAERE|nr:hypothetical protein CRE_30548 [Caenorhabditis remanei]